ncbi:MAG: chorismate synthase [Firmicutes bacterium]|nr:chorismate synthase [Bacillota bacterium]
MRFLTSGESHGQALVAVIEGFPAQVRITKEEIDRELARRQMGYGRGGRMKIESDQVEILSGVRQGLTIGSPICLQISNRDWVNWSSVMAPFHQSIPEEVVIKEDPRLPKLTTVVTVPRPGHADLSGALKYGFTDLRNIIERASARETSARVGVGAFAKQLLKEFGIRIGSYVLSIGKAGTGPVQPLTPDQQEQVDQSPVRAFPPEAAEEMIRMIDQARQNQETLGGTFVVYATGLLPGLGSHVHWDRRLDGRLAQAVMSIPAIKGVGFGAGFKTAAFPGSQVQDPITYSPEIGFRRTGNNAGGIEGGMTNGEPLVLTAVMKPIPTLYQGLPSVDLKTLEPTRAGAERSDLTAVPAAGVVAEAMVAWVLAEAVLEKFGGDSLPEIKQAWLGYREGLRGKAKGGKC